MGVTALVLAQPSKTCPFLTERLLMGCKESNQTNKNTECRNNSDHQKISESQLLVITLNDNMPLLHLALIFQCLT